MKGLLKSVFTVPNILSIIRIILIWPFIIFSMYGNYIVAGVTLVVSAISDLFDGFIARKFNQTTDLGKMLDPIADKLTLMAVMICVGLKFQKILPFMVLLVVKEVLMLLAGAFLLKRRQIPPAAKWFGKVATAVFYVSVVSIICLKAFWNIESEFLNISLMSLTVICMIYAFWRYLKIFMSMIKNDNVKT